MSNDNSNKNGNSKSFVGFVAMVCFFIGFCAGVIWVEKNFSVQSQQMTSAAMKQKVEMHRAQADQIAEENIRQIAQAEEVIRQSAQVIAEFQEWKEEREVENKRLNDQLYSTIKKFVAFFRDNVDKTYATTSVGWFKLSLNVKIFCLNDTNDTIFDLQQYDYVMMSESERLALLDRVLEEVENCNNPTFE